MRSLLLSAFTPALNSGQGLRTYAIARALASRGELDLMYVPFGAPKPAPEYEAVAGLHMIEIPASRGRRRIHSFSRAILSGVPLDIARGVSGELLSAAKNEGGEAEALVADGPVAAAAILPLARERAAIYNAHNLESSFRHQAAAGGRRGRGRLERFERKLLETYAESWMCSRADLDGARQLVPTARLRYVPNVIDVAAIEPSFVEPADPPTLLFVGSLDYAPNRDAARFLVSEVMPLLWHSVPDAKLRVVGSGDPGIEIDDKRIEQAGFVDDLATEYATATCVVIPLRSGGGSPLKFIEALAYGRPVVASPRAAAGLDLTGDEYISAEGAHATSAAIESVLRGVGTDMAARGRAAVERLYSIEALSERLQNDD